MASNDNVSAMPARVAVASVINAQALAGASSSDRQNPRRAEDNIKQEDGNGDEEEEDVEPLNSPLPSVQGSFSFNFRTLPSDLDNMWPSSLDGYDFIGRLFATKTTEAHVAVTRVQDVAAAEKPADTSREKPLAAVMDAVASATAAASSVVAAVQAAQTAQTAAVKASTIAAEAVVTAAAGLDVDSNPTAGSAPSSGAVSPSESVVAARSTNSDNIDPSALSDAGAVAARAAEAAAAAAEAASAARDAAGVSTNMAGNVSNETAKYIGRFCVVRRINFERVDMSMGSFRRSALVMSPAARGHSNVLSMFTAFADRHFLYIVQPNMNLGSLVEVMVQRQQYVNLWR